MPRHRVCHFGLSAEAGLEAGEPDFPKYLTGIGYTDCSPLWVER